MNAVNESSLIDLFIGRQPIYDENLNVVAYELLFRSGEANSANVVDGDSATTDVLLNAITEIGIEQLVGVHRAFINLTHNHVLQMAEKPFHEIKDRLVLEVLEDIKAEKPVVDAITSLAKKGFKIALDDFIYDDSLQPLVDIADIIKIDLMALSREELDEQVKILQDGNRKLLAEKVETEEEYEHCKTLGFHYYQGYYFSKPQIIKGQKLPANKLAAMELLSKLQDPESSIEDLVATVSHDITMSVRVLRYLNSAQFGMGKEIESIQKAILMLGRSTIRNLANLVAMSKVEGKPHELIITSMVRARMAENIAGRTSSDKDISFTTGLLSIIDSLMNQDMETLTNSLPLPENIKTALLHHEGELGKILKCVLSYELADWNNAKYAELSIDEIRDSYLDAIEWATRSATLLH